MTQERIDEFDAKSGSLLGSTTVTIPPAQVNRTTLEQQGLAALATNRTDITQAQAIVTQATSLLATSTVLTVTQTRSLMNAVKTLAEHDIATKQQVNSLIRLVLSRLDGTD